MSERYQRGTGQHPRQTVGGRVQPPAVLSQNHQPSHHCGQALHTAASAHSCRQHRLQRPRADGDCRAAAATLTEAAAHERHLHEADHDGQEDAEEVEADAASAHGRWTARDAQKKQSMASDASGPALPSQVSDKVCRQLTSSGNDPRIDRSKSLRPAPVTASQFGELSQQTSLTACRASANNSSTHELGSLNVKAAQIRKPGGHGQVSGEQQGQNEHEAAPWERR